MKKLKIYIAGAYSSDTEEGKLQNTLKAVDAGIKVFKMGHYPYIPHLTHWVDQRSIEINNLLTYEDYMEWDDVFLQCCDAFLYLSKSKGADVELSRAKKMGKIIFYSLKEILEII